MHPVHSLDQLAARLGGEVRGDGSVTVGRVATLETAGEGDIAFLANPKYRGQLAGCKASAVIVHPDTRDLASQPCIVTDDPYLYFARVAQILNPAKPVSGGVALGATVASELPASVFVAAGASIGTGVVIGEGSSIGPGCSIGDGVRIGPRCVLHSRVTVYADCIIGSDAIIHSGVVVGADGFGFARDKDGSWVKIPQTGRVVIGDDVEIGANTTIDRGALDDTVIEDGVKLDNQIQIGHNVHIGAHTIMAACAGVAGSTRIGKRCMIGGQAGISGHLTIADDVVISAWTLVAKSITRKGVYTSNLPLQTREDWIKNFAHLRHLDAMANRIRALEQQAPQGKTTS